MKNLLSLFMFSLFFVSFQSIANRPAEDDSPPYLRPATSDTSSSIPAPDSQNQEVIAEQPPVENLMPETQQSGDVIKLEDTPTQNRIILLDFPQRGMEMSKVLNELGEPSTRFPAIGKPPITRWVYPDRTVFFEYSHVIHVVAQ